MVGLEFLKGNGVSKDLKKIFNVHIYKQLH